MPYFWLETSPASFAIALLRPFRAFRYGLGVPSPPPSRAGTSFPLAPATFFFPRPFLGGAASTLEASSALSASFRAFSRFEGAFAFLAVGASAPESSTLVFLPFAGALAFFVGASSALTASESLPSSLICWRFFAAALGFFVGGS